MGIVYTLYHRDSNEISAIITELKSLGYIPDRDFDFSFSTGRYDWENLQYVAKKTVFTFYNEELASWFMMKWT